MDGRPLEVWGDGKVVRDYIYIDDLCASVSRLIADPRSEGVFNIGSGVGHTLLEVVETVETVEAVTSRKLEIIFRDARAVDVPRVVLDCSKAASLIAHTPRPLVEGVRAFADAIEASHR